MLYFTIEQYWYYRGMYVGKLVKAGCCSAGDPSTYNCTFPAMIDDWRGKWKNASQHTSSLFPFGFVQVHHTLVFLCLSGSVLQNDCLSLSPSWLPMAPTTVPHFLLVSQSSAGLRQQTMASSPTLVSGRCSWRLPWILETPPPRLAPSILEINKM